MLRIRCRLESRAQAHFSNLRRVLSSQGAGSVLGSEGGGSEDIVVMEFGEVLARTDLPVGDEVMGWRLSFVSLDQVPGRYKRHRPPGNSHPRATV
jgi:hypothetical protein